MSTGEMVPSPFLGMSTGSWAGFTCTQISFAPGWGQAVTPHYKPILWEGAEQ